MNNKYKRWAILWPGNESTSDYLIGNTDTGMTTLYRTRADARKDIGMRRFNSMLKGRRDLRQPPHEWKAKRPVKVLVTVEALS